MNERRKAQRRRRGVLNETETSVCLLEYRNYTGKCRNLVDKRKLLKEGWRIQLNFDPEKKLLELHALQCA